jgi:arylsulfatase A-like enzyme
MHGFDEFFGNLYHLNAEEEPENRDYPANLKLANGKTFREQFGPRGVLKCKADGKGGQTIEDTGAAHPQAHGDGGRGNPRRRKGIHPAPT